MKKVALIVCVLVMAAGLVSASQRVVVAEDFTATWCTYCPSAARGLDSLSKMAKDTFIVLGHHSSPSGDPFYLAKSANRASYYGLQYYPTVYFDGPDSIIGGAGTSMYNYYRPKFDAHKVVVSPLDIYIYGQSSDSLYVVIKNTSASLINGTLQFHIVERHIPYSWQGMPEVDFLVRDILPTASGQAVSIPISDSIVVQMNPNIKSAWKNGCHVVAYVQGANKTIYQAAKISTSTLGVNFSLSELAGNANNYFDPGETGQIVAYVTNKSESGTNAKVILTSDDPYINITNGTFIIGNFNINDSTSNQGAPFTFDILASTPQAHKCQLLIRTEITTTGLVGKTTDTIYFRVGTPSNQVWIENFESGLGNWISGGTGGTVNWDTTSTQSYSPSFCITDSRSGNYTNSINRYIAMNSDIDLSAYPGAELSWWERYATEDGYDFCNPEYSINSGSTWLPLIAKYSGSQTTWIKRKVDITDYMGTKGPFRIRYRITSDASVVGDGWYVDDVKFMAYENTGVASGPQTTPPTKTSLLPASPNPTSGRTMISYQLAVPGRVSLGLYDVAGRLVRTLVSENQASGHYKTAWDGRDNTGKPVANGVYFYHLTAGDYNASRRLTIVR